MISNFLRVKKIWIVLCWVLLSNNFNSVLCKDLNIANLYDSIIVMSIQENKDYFLKQIETKNVKTRNDSLLFAIIHSNKKTNYYGKLVYDLIRYDQENHSSIFIEDTVITRILLRLVANPTDNGTDEEYILIDLLKEKCRPDYIPKNSSLIKNALEENIKADNRYVFGLYCLLLNKAEKDSILRNKFIYKKGTSMAIGERCMLGDSCAVDSVKEMYKKAESHNTLKNCAYYLKYLNADTSIPEVLMTKWCNNKIYRTVTGRVLICNTLAYLFPANPIFKNNRELFNSSDKRYALFYNKTKDEQLLFRMKELDGDTIPDSLVNYEVVKKRVTDIQNWYNKNYKTKITCEIQKPYFTKRNETIYDRGGMQSTPVVKGDDFDMTKFKRVEKLPSPDKLFGK